MDTQPKADKIGLQGVVSEITDSLKKREVAIFHGAGISKNSGVPDARSMEKYILSSVISDENRLSALMERNFPFELLMQVVMKHSDITPILRIFQLGSPNANHYLFSKLASQSLVNQVVTPNFDHLTERCMMNELGPHQVEVCWNEEQYKKLKGNKISRFPIVFKPHGTVDDKINLVITLNEVAKNPFYSWRGNLIQSLFSSKFAPKVLILGYSCSDSFDFSPVIRSIKKNRVTVIYIEHSSKCVFERTPLWEGNSQIFRGYPGYRVKCNTDSLINSLWACLKPIIGPKRDRSTQDETWTSFVDDWHSSLNKQQSFSIAAEFYKRLSELALSAEYYEKGLRETAEFDSITKERFWANLCYIYSHFDLIKANEYGDKIQEKAMPDINAQCILNIAKGNINHNNHKFPQAIYHYRRALYLSKKIGDSENIASNMYCLANICAGYAKHFIDNQGTANACTIDYWLKKSEEYLLESIVLAKDGWVATEIRSNLLLAQLKMQQKEWLESHPYLNRARKLAEFTSDNFTLARILQNIGDLYFDQIKVCSDYNWHKAVKYYQKAILVGEKSNKEISGVCHLQLALLYKTNQQKFKKMFDYHSERAKFYLTGNRYYGYRLAWLND